MKVPLSPITKRALEEISEVEDLDQFRILCDLTDHDRYYG